MNGRQQTDLCVTYEKNGRTVRRVIRDVAETLTPAMAVEFANAAIREIEIF